METLIQEHGLWILTVIGVLGLIWAFSDYLPIQWSGWGRTKRSYEIDPPRDEKPFNVESWQGREFYPLQIAAALWHDLEPLEADPDYSLIQSQLRLLKLQIRMGKLECEVTGDSTINHGTPISADSLRRYAEKQGEEVPRFLQKPR